MEKQRLPVQSMVCLGSLGVVGPHMGNPSEENRGKRGSAKQRRDPSVLSTQVGVNLGRGLGYLVQNIARKTEEE